MRVLFVTWAGGGNVPPALHIARVLRDRGDAVGVLGPERLRSQIEAHALEFHAFRAGGDYDAATPSSTLRSLASVPRLLADRGIGKDAVAVARERSADLVVVDCMLWGAMDEVARAGLRWASIVHSLYGYFRGFARGPMGGLVRLRGVDAPRVFAAAPLSIVATLRELESDPARALPDTVRHVGFVWQGLPVPAAAASGRPRVLVSLSTVSFPAQQRVLQTALDAVGAMDVDVIATTGTIDPAALRPAPNTEVVRFVDHAEVLSTTSLVIGHGGHSTTARALGYGVPLVAIPLHPLLDQPAVARSVQRLGVGRALRTSASASDIRHAADALLADGPERRAARALGEHVRSSDGAAVAADALSELVPAR